MKKRSHAAAAKCIALIGAVWEEWPEPTGDQVRAYQKLQPVDYRLLHIANLPPSDAGPTLGHQGQCRHHGWSELTETEPSSLSRTFTYTSGGGIRLIDAPAGRISQLVIEPQTVL